MAKSTGHIRTANTGQITAPTVNDRVVAEQLVRQRACSNGRGGVIQSNEADLLGNIKDYGSAKG
eukprot:scaffold57178_cov17-Prasinocladus_malaysianus.AAC.1